MKSYRRRESGGTKAGKARSDPAAWQLQAVIALHAACLNVGVLSVELKKLNAEGCALPIQELFGVEIRTMITHYSSFHYRVGATGDESVRIHQPEAPSRSPESGGQLKQASRETGAGKFIFGGRLPVIESELWLPVIGNRDRDSAGGSAQRADGGTDAMHRRHGGKAQNKPARNNPREIGRASLQGQWSLTLTRAADPEHTPYAATANSRRILVAIQAGVLWYLLPW